MCYGLGRSCRREEEDPGEDRPAAAGILVLAQAASPLLTSQKAEPRGDAAVLRFKIKPILPPQKISELKFLGKLDGFVNNIFFVQVKFLANK